MSAPLPSDEVGRPPRPERELLTEATRLNEELSALVAVTDSALSTLDLGELITVLLDRLLRVMRADAGAILLEERGRLVVRAMAGLRAPDGDPPSLPAGAGVGGRIFETGQPLYVGDVRHDPRVLGPFLGDQGIASMLGVPLRTRDRLVGVLHVDWRQPHAESASDLRLLETAAERCAAAIVNAQLFAELRAANASAERLLAREQEARSVAERTEQLIVSILERVTDAFVALDTSWTYTYVSRKAAEIFGRRPEDLLGKHIWTEFPEGVGQPFYHAYYRAAAEQVAISFEEYYPPYDRWFENRVYPSPDGLSIFFSDVTERRRTDERLRSTNEQLRALSARVQTVREEEAARIAREIHDELGQLLTGLRMDVGWIRSRVAQIASSETTPILARADAVAELTERTIRTVQRISEELRPAALDQLGLEAAIGAQLDVLSERSGIATSLDGTLGDRRLGDAIETGVFRIVQELLTNVARHSQATAVRVDLRLEGGQGETLVVRMTDNGRGIRPSELASARSIGLLGLRERAILLGGTVDLSGEPGRGTEAVVRVPSGAAAS